MKINFSTPIKALNGENRKDGAEVFRLRDACVVALDRVDADDSKPEAKEKARRGHLAMRIYGAKEPIALELADVALIQRLVGRVYQSAILIAQIEDMLDPKDKPEEPKTEPKAKIPKP